MQEWNMVDDYENTEELKAITKLDFHLALTDFYFKINSEGVIKRRQHNSTLKFFTKFDQLRWKNPKSLVWQ